MYVCYVYRTGAMGSDLGKPQRDEPVSTTLVKASDLGDSHLSPFIERAK